MKDDGSRNGVACSAVHNVYVHAESTPPCCQGQKRCCNLVKGSSPSISEMVKGEKCYSIKCSLGGGVKLQHTSDDGKLSEPGGGSDLPGAITGNLSHFRESGKRFTGSNGNFEVGK